MPRCLYFVGIAVISCSVAPLSWSQSLGEVARQQQQKKGTGTESKTRQVITDDDLKPSSTSSSDSSSGSVSKNKEKKPKPQDSESADANAPSAAELQERIKDQKQRIHDVEALIKEIQEKLEPWKTSDCTHVVYAGTGKNTCDLPPKLNTELERAKSELKTEQANLEEMQEEARRLGYGNSVYDPR